MEGEQALQEAVKSERDALQAELEAVRAQRLAFAAELEQMRRERAELEAEKEKIRTEKQALLAEREAVRVMSGRVKTPNRNTSRRRRKEKAWEKDTFSHVTNGFGCQKTNGQKGLPLKPGPPLRQAFKRMHSPDRLDEGGGCKSSPKTRLKRSRLDHLYVSGNEKEHRKAVKAISEAQQQRQSQGVQGSLTAVKKREQKSGPKTQQQRKKQFSPANEEKGARTRRLCPKMQQKPGTDGLEVNSADSGGDNDDVDEDGMTYPAAEVDDELENLSVSFDQPVLNSSQTPCPAHSPLAGDGDNGDAAVEGEAVQDKTATSISIKSPRSQQPRTTTPHVCKDCGRSFRWTSHYLNHLKTHSGDRSHQCSECQKTFTRANHLAVHMRKHTTAQKQYVCSHCSLVFSSATGLRKHVHNSHSKPAKARKEFKCPECREVFTKASSLAVHMGVHSDGKPFKCTDCKASFTSQGNLTVHLKKHRGEKPFRCTECEATFPRSADLRSHARKHSTVKPYVCKICCAAFCRAGDLKPHMRTHTGEKPFQCEVCGAAFSTSSNLAVHRRTHTGERPFQCDKCGAAFSQLGHLTRHSMQHSTEHAYRCTSCQATFGNAYHLKVHMQRHNTDNTFKCKCGAAFSRASILTEHMRIHTGEKPYKCNQCPAAFARSANLAAHRRKHTGERPYVCPHCQQGFTQSTSLNRHLQSKNACLTRRGLTKAQGGDGLPSVSAGGGVRGGGEPSHSIMGQDGLRSSSSGVGVGDGVGDSFYPEDIAGMKLQRERGLPAGGLGVDQNHFLSATSVAAVAVASSALGSSQPCGGFDSRNGAAVDVHEESKAAASNVKELQVVNIFSLRRSAQEENVPRTSLDPAQHQQQFCFPPSDGDAALEQPGMKDSIFSEGTLPTSTSVLPQGSSVPSGAVSSAALHVVGSLGNASSSSSSSLMPLPSIAMVTDYQGGSGPADSLMALRSVGPAASFFHQHLSQPHLPLPHGQVHHQ